MFHVEPSFLESLATERAGWRAAGLERSLRTVSTARGPLLTLDGREVVAFASNDYLGLATNPVVADAMAAAAKTLGSGATASRLVAGNWEPHDQLEAVLCAWKGTEASLLFGSGYQANVGVISALVGRDDLVLSDALNHASIVDGCRLSRARVAIYRHRDLDHLASLLDQPARRRLVVSDSVFSMDGDRAPVDDLVALCRRHGAVVVFDEAHAAGVLGAEGRGLAPVAPDVLQVGTFGKALGVYGAYATGSRLLIDTLLQRARSFIYTTALPPAVIAAVRAALAWARSAEGDAARATLAGQAQRLHQHLRLLDLAATDSPSHVMAVFAAHGAPEQAMAATAALLADGIYVQGIRPPTVPVGSARLRVALSARHSTAQLDQLLGALTRHRSLFAAPSELP